MLQAVVNSLYSYTNGADPPSPTALDPQQIAVKREESRKMSWVQATAYNISHQQKELVGKPHKDIDRDSLGHISYEAHWLKAGKSGKLVAALVCPTTPSSP